MRHKTHSNLLFLPFEISGFKTNQRSSTKYLIQKFINLPIFLFLFTLTCVNLFYCDGVLEVTQTLQSMCSYGHVLLRKILLFSNTSKLEDLHSCGTFFWKYDLFGKKLGHKFRRKMTVARSICFSFSIMATVVAVLFAVSPFVYQDQDLPQPCWVPKPELLPFIHVLQVFYVLELGVLDCFLDFTFIITCVELEIQFSLLQTALCKVEIETMREEVCFNILKKCSTQHVLLMTVHKKLQSTFSFFFLITYLLSVEGIFVQLFLIHEVKVTWGQFLLAILYIVSVVSQCSSVFLVASNLEAEIENLVCSIYGIDWYNTNDKKILTFVIFMIMNAQKSLYITGMGLFRVNRTVLLQILRTGFSISTLLQQK
ncbi:hypothetical protein Zmor_015749 [Zophobas morio]|uniref:Odorant receptor n=1 Tax=Zophobas morio TaxID=2755281 RepID=A0AA38IML4_9CUCU|nr:hypothetical protein Zmor_015749 [Zophobas morio]